MLAAAIIAVGLMSMEAQDYHAAMHEYEEKLARVKSHARHASLEDVYAAAVRLGEAIAAGTTLESMPASEFDALQTKLPGLILNREEALIAEPRPSYFADLAQKFGGPEDRAFFAVLSHIRPDGAWAIYVEQQTDYSGCTRFGGGSLVDSYRQWRRFRSRFPRAYAPFVARGLADVEEQVTESSCACGSAEETARGLDEFAAAFPDSRASAAASHRSRAILRHQSAIRFRCVSG
jgi:hypothetical protein